MFNANGQELLYPDMHKQFTDPFASHVYLAILYTLNGQATKNLAEAPEEPKSKKRKRAPKVDIVLQTPSFFATLREKLIAIVKAWDISRFQSLALDKYAVPLLLTIIESDIPRKEKKDKKEKKKRNQTIANLILFGGIESNSDEVSS